MSSSNILFIKVGTGVLTTKEGLLDQDTIARLAQHIGALVTQGTKVVLVSSGAVGAGVPLLNLSEYPQDIATRQAAAAIGQAHLMHTYDDHFSPHGIKTAQILVSSMDLQVKSHRERVSDVLTRLLEHERVLPIVNENDVVSLRELTKTDNDMLAANLSNLMKAQHLILLTSVDGLLDDQDSVIKEVQNISEIRAMVTQDSGEFSIGGMHSKLDAVEVARESGTQVIIGNGDAPERLSGYLTKSSLGTYFY